MDTDQLTTTQAPPVRAPRVWEATGPVAQGDVLAVPAHLLDTDPSRWLPATRTPLGSSHHIAVVGENNHVVTGTGVTVTDGPRRGSRRPDKSTAPVDNLACAIHVPTGGHATLTHQGPTAHHRPILLGPGTWLIVRQLAPNTTPRWQTPARVRPVAAAPAAPPTGSRDRRGLAAAARGMDWGFVRD